MKNYFFIIGFIMFSVFGFTQDFDDIPYARTDPMTYFQQEMTSLMQFQFRNDINIPFFISFSVDIPSWKYNENEMKSIAPGFDIRNSTEASSMNMGALIGFQFKLNNSFYLPLFLYAGQSDVFDFQDDGYWASGTGTESYYTITKTQIGKLPVFPGIGLVFNSDLFKGGVYLGIASGTNIEVTRFQDTYHGDDFNFVPKIAFLPIVNTSNWAYVGKALEHIMGFIGIGDLVYEFDEKDDSKFGAAMSALNLLLDFSFNRIHFNSISLNTNAYYKRDNYDISARTDNFGLKLQGSLTNLPIAFSINGGYKHFYQVFPDFASAYHDTFFIEGGIFVLLNRFGNIGLTYQYDSIMNSKIILSYSNNFISGLVGFRPSPKRIRTFDGKKVESEEGKYQGWGVRFRWGGWKVK